LMGYCDLYRTVKVNPHHVKNEIILRLQGRDLYTCGKNFM